MAKLETESQSFNTIGTGTTIRGEINCDGDIRVDGTINGNLNCKGRVLIGPTGIINGEIICRNSDISGKVEGKVKVAELLSLKSTAKINGDIITSKLAIEPNAIFSGTCKMGTENMPNVEIRKEAEPVKIEQKPIK